ncbi:hypothetical protein D3C77_408360 [compost metagenome]
MKNLFSSAALVSFVMLASSQVMAKQDYTVHFKNASNQTKYVRQIGSQCMYGPKNGSAYTVPPQGDVSFGMTDSDNIFSLCTSGAKEVSWAVEDDKGIRLGNLTFRHIKDGGTWYTKVVPSLGLSATITCNNGGCSTSGTPGMPGEPSPIVVTFK